MLAIIKTENKKVVGVDVYASTTASEKDKGDKLASFAVTDHTQTIDRDAYIKGVETKLQTPNLTRKGKSRLEKRLKKLKADPNFLKLKTTTTKYTLVYPSGHSQVLYSREQIKTHAKRACKSKSSYDKYFAKPAA